jgi:hypothetical protein
MRSNERTVRATEEDRESAHQILKEQLRSGKISYEEFEERRAAVARAKHLVEVYDNLSGEHGRIKARGVRRVMRLSTLNFVVLFLSLAALGGLLGSVPLGWEGLGILLLIVIVINVASSLRRSKSLLVRSDRST